MVRTRTFILGSAWLLVACGAPGPDEGGMAETAAETTDAGSTDAAASGDAASQTGGSNPTGDDPPGTSGDSAETSDPPDPQTTGETEETGVDTDDDVPDIPAECEGSVLADIVAGMAPGSWAEMPENPSLDALEMSYALLYWSDSGAFDPTTRQLHWVGGPGSCCADPPTYQRVSYDELSDTWSIEATPYVGSGHSYDGNAIDPQTGEHYFARFSTPNVHVYDGEGWSDLPALPVSPATTNGLTWFPELGGLLYVGDSDDLALYADGSWSVLDPPQNAWGVYNVFAEYSAVHGVVWIGGGNGATGINYTLDSDGVLTRQPDAPVALANGSSHHFADPATGDFIVHNFDSGQWWQLDPVAMQWSQIDMDAPEFAGSAFHVPLPHCGVTLFFDHYWEQRRIHLYRHG